MELSKRVAVKVADGKIVRFGVSQILEHWLMMVAFTALVITGLPQRFSDNSWSQSVIENLGGIYTTRLIHRIFGFVLVFEALYHVGSVLNHALIRKRPLSMMLTFRDFQDAVTALRYDLGLTDHPPQYARYDFGQKFEYWGMVFGSTVMIGSGLILMFPVTATRLLPGEFIPAAKAAHGYEGLLALLIILVWHLYSTHLGPGKFPFDRSIFTGRISRERMKREHRLEYDETFGEKAPGVVRLPGIGEETKGQGSGRRG